MSSKFLVKPSFSFVNENVFLSCLESKVLSCFLKVLVAIGIALPAAAAALALLFSSGPLVAAAAAPAAVNVLLLRLF